MSIPLDAIITIFIFLIGLPAFTLQILDRELRRIVLKWHSQLIFYTIVPILLSGVVFALGLKASLICNQETEPNHFVGKALVAVFGHDEEYVWIAILIVLLSIVGSSTLLITAYWRRRPIIHKLSRLAARKIPMGGRLAEPDLKELVQLGVQSQPGQDKALVLKALARLAESVQANAKYDGARLEDLILGLEEILGAGPQIASPMNFQFAADLLSNLIMSACKKKSADDLKLAIQTVSMSGRLSLHHEPSHIQNKFVEALTLANNGQPEGSMWVSQALFEIGSEAVERHQMLVAMAALSKNESLLLRQSPTNGELARDFISLLAHFWAQGEAAKNYATPYLKDAPSYFSQPLPEVIKAAQKHCEKTARFKTSGHLSQMLDGIKLARLHKSKIFQRKTGTSN